MRSTGRLLTRLSRAPSHSLVAPSRVSERTNVRYPTLPTQSRRGPLTQPREHPKRGRWERSPHPSETHERTLAHSHVGRTHSRPLRPGGSGCEAQASLDMRGDLHCRRRGAWEHRRRHSGGGPGASGIRTRVDGSAGGPWPLGHGTTTRARWLEATAPAPEWRPRRELNSRPPDP